MGVLLWLATAPQLALVKWVALGQGATVLPFIPVESLPKPSVWTSALWLDLGPIFANGSVAACQQCGRAPRSKSMRCTVESVHTSPPISRKNFSRKNCLSFGSNGDNNNEAGHPVCHEISLPMLSKARSVVLLPRMSWKGWMSRMALDNRWGIKENILKSNANILFHRVNSLQNILWQMQFGKDNLFCRETLHLCALTSNWNFKKGLFGKTDTVWHCFDNGDLGIKTFTLRDLSNPESLLHDDFVSADDDVVSMRVFTPSNLEMIHHSRSKQHWSLHPQLMKSMLIWQKQQLWIEQRHALGWLNLWFSLRASNDGFVENWKQRNFHFHKKGKEKDNCCSMACLILSLPLVFQGCGWALVLLLTNGWQISNKGHVVTCDTSVSSARMPNAFATTINNSKWKKNGLFAEWLLMWMQGHTWNWPKWNQFVNTRHFQHPPSLKNHVRKRKQIQLHPKTVCGHCSNKCVSATNLLTHTLIGLCKSLFCWFKAFFHHVHKESTPTTHGCGEPWMTKEEVQNRWDWSRMAKRANVHLLNEIDAQLRRFAWIFCRSIDRYGVNHNNQPSEATNLLPFVVLQRPAYIQRQQ